MVRVLAILSLLICPVVLCGCAGCTFYPNSGSEAVTYDGDKGLVPANGPGYMNGEPMDARSKH